ncbi:MAG: DUF4339 domain-containing protein [Thermoleophilia bacterium]|nr:DUF4339 domain-containing protein [Thermoleophilia bacterium]
MISPDQLRSICRKYAGMQDFYSGGDIPANKLINARKSLKIPGREDVFALINCTVFGSAKDAIVIASSGIFAKNNDMVGAQYFSWKDLSELSIVGSQERLSASEVTFSDGRSINCTGQMMGVAKGIVPLLNDLLVVLKAADESLDWFVVVDGVQQGPYSRKTLKQMVMDGVIVPAAASVWRDGMSSWAPMQDVAELAVQPRGPVPPPFVPPQQAAPTPPPWPGPGVAQGAQAQASFQAGAQASSTTAPPAFGTATTVPAQTAGAQSAGGQTPGLHAGGQTGELVDLNSAHVDELVLLPAMTLAHARAIEKERSVRLGFTRVEEVGEFLGLQPHQVEQLRPLIAFAVYSAGGGAAAGKRLIDF